MPVHKSVTPDRRVSLNAYDISRWTGAGKNQALYQTIAGVSNSDMRGSDNLLFDPRQMVGNAPIGRSQTEPSYQRFEQLQMRPVYMYAGGFLLFLVVLKYLTSPK